MKQHQNGPPRGGGKRFKISDDLLWGVHPVFEALSREPDRVSEVILQGERHGKKYEEITQLAREAGVKISFVSSFRLSGAGASEARHQGVLARTSSAPLMDFEELLARFAARVQAGNGRGWWFAIVCRIRTTLGRSFVRGLLPEPRRCS